MPLQLHIVRPLAERAAPLDPLWVRTRPAWALLLAVVLLVVAWLFAAAARGSADLGGDRSVAT